MLLSLQVCSHQLGSVAGGARGLHFLCPALRFVTHFLALCIWSFWEARPLEARDSSDALWFITLLACARWLLQLELHYRPEERTSFPPLDLCLEGLVEVYLFRAGRASGLVATHIPALRQALWPCGTAFRLILQRLAPLYAHLGVQFALACARSGLRSFVFRRLAPKLFSAAVAARPASRLVRLSPPLQAWAPTQVAQEAFCSSRWVAAT